MSVLCTPMGEMEMMPWKVFNTCAASVVTMFIKTYGNLLFVRSLTANGEPTNSMD